MEVGMIDKFWMVIVASEVMVVCGPLILAKSVFRNDSCITSKRKGKEIEQNGLVTQS